MIVVVFLSDSEGKRCIEKFRPGSSLPCKEIGFSIPFLFRYRCTKNTQSEIITLVQVIGLAQSSPISARYSDKVTYSESISTVATVLKPV